MATARGAPKRSAGRRPSGSPRGPRCRLRHRGSGRGRRRARRAHRSIHEIVGRLMPARNFYIALTDDEQRTLRFSLFIDERDSPPGPDVRPLGRGLTAYLVRARRAMFLKRSDQEALERDGEVILGGPFSRTGSARRSPWAEHPRRHRGADLRLRGGVPARGPRDPLVRRREVALVLQHKQSEDLLREANRTMRTLVDNLPEWPTGAPTTSRGPWNTCRAASASSRVGRGGAARNRKLSFASLIDLQTGGGSGTRCSGRSRPAVHGPSNTGSAPPTARRSGSGNGDPASSTATSSRPEGFFTDVTERRRAEDESARLAKERGEALHREAVADWPKEWRKTSMHPDARPARCRRARGASEREPPGRGRARRGRARRELIGRLLVAGRRSSTSMRVVDLRQAVADRERELRARLPAGSPCGSSSARSPCP